MRVCYQSRLFRVIKALGLVGQCWAITLGEWILTERSPLEFTERNLRHEQTHVRQWRRWGYVLFPFAYFGATLWAMVRHGWRKGYAMNVFELEAYAAGNAVPNCAACSDVGTRCEVCGND